VTSSGALLNLLLPGLLTVLLYALALFVVVASRRPIGRTPRPVARVRRPPTVELLRPATPARREPPRLRLIEGGAARQAR
jgi:hypothetical protein